MMKIRLSLVFISFAFCLASCVNKPGITISNQLTGKPVQYGISELQKVKNHSGNWVVQTTLDPNLAAEAFQLSISGENITVSGGDATGIMYGLLSIKEQLNSNQKEINPENESPRFPFRAIKFNLPWNSYRIGEALQQHYESCRDTMFWHSFLDMMAENRFNALTLWNLHPFNYLVKTAKYPEACGFTDNEMAEWETFWKAIFRMAKEQGIETYLINWNIFISPEFAQAHGIADYCINGDYFIENGDTSEIIKDYIRECVKEVIDKYPDLTGLGITLGEGMGGMTSDEREKWLLDSYIQGMREASRKVKFIHRVPLSAGKWSGGTTDPVVTLTCVDGPITIELKFNWSHGHSCPELVKVHGGELTDAYWNPVPGNYKFVYIN